MEKFFPMKKRSTLFTVLFLVASFLFIGTPAFPGPPSPLEKEQAAVSRRLAEAFMAEGRYRQALKELQKSQALDEANAELHFDLGTVYLCLSQPEMAVSSFRRAIVLKPDYSVAKNSLGAALMAVGRYDEAVPVLEELCENLVYATPQFPLLNLGFIYYSKKQYDKSETYYKRAVEQAPTFAQAWRGLGRIYADTGRLAESLEAYDRAVKAAPFFAQAFLEMGDVHESAGHGEEAVSAWKRALDVSPGADLAAEAKKRLSRYAVP